MVRRQLTKKELRAEKRKRIFLKLKKQLEGTGDKPELHRGQIDFEFFNRKVRKLRSGVWSFRFGGMEYRSRLKIQIIKTLIRLKLLRV